MFEEHQLYHQIQLHCNNHTHHGMSDSIFTLYAQYAPQTQPSYHIAHHLDNELQSY